MSRGRQTRDCLSETLPDLDTPETFHFDGHLYVGWSRSRDEDLARAVWSDRTHPLPNSNAPAPRVPLEALSVIWRRSRLFPEDGKELFRTRRNVVRVCCSAVNGDGYVGTAKIMPAN